METAILSATYFGPIQWYQKLNRMDACIIDPYEHFVKQSYRSRCIISTTQGLQKLSVPVIFENHMPLKDVEISDHGNWRHLHWNALCSAYGESPFFEYYQDDIRPFFEKKWKWLLDYDMEILEKMIELLDLDKTYGKEDSSISLSKEYVQLSSGDNISEDQLSDPQANLSIKDFRMSINPKHPGEDPDFQSLKYYQVYQQKFGFQENLSILDLLFNEGNEAVFYL